MFVRLSKTNIKLFDDSITISLLLQQSIIYRVRYAIFAKTISTDSDGMYNKQCGDNCWFKVKREEEKVRLI